MELQLEDTRTQMEVEARQRASADKLRRQAENELEDLREQIDALEESNQDFESAKTRLELEIEDVKKGVCRQTFFEIIWPFASLCCFSFFLYMIRQNFRFNSLLGPDFSCLS